MSEQVERVNKWAYFVQNIGWILAIPVFATLLYTNMSNRIDAQEKEIAQLRSQISDVNTSLVDIQKQQQAQLVVLTEIKTTLLDRQKTSETKNGH